MRTAATFRWTLEDEAVGDLNGVEFMLDGLNSILRAQARDLPPPLAHDTRKAIALGVHLFVFRQGRILAE